MRQASSFLKTQTTTKVLTTKTLVLRTKNGAFPSQTKIAKISKLTPRIKERTTSSWGESRRGGKIQVFRSMIRCKR